MQRPNYDVVVIGGGLVGLATAYAFLVRNPGRPVLVLEKESEVAQHQSGRNSGVLHAGLYYRPLSAKARLSVRGLRSMVRYCSERGVAHEQCGKLVVAASCSEIPRLRDLYARGIANGLEGLEWLSGEQAREIEPEVSAVAAVRVPQEGIVDYVAVAKSLAADVEVLGGEIETCCRLEGAVLAGKAWRLHTSAGEVQASRVVNCAGLHSDRVATMMKVRRTIQIVPFRGDYFRLRPDRQHLVRHLIYPVPDPTFPFLGVHFTRMVRGGVECGPSAVLAFKREGYSRTDVSLRDAAEILSYRGVWRFLGRHVRTAAAEYARAASRAAFTKALQRLVPAVQAEDLEPGGSGVRAQAMSPDGRLVQDFVFLEGPYSLHVLNAPSPAATASLAIGEEIADRLAGLN